MVAVLAELTPWDPVTAAPVTLRASSHDDHRVCSLNDQTWWPTLASRGRLTLDLFDAAFGGKSQVGVGGISIDLSAFPDAARYTWGDKPAKLYVGNPGDAWGAYTLLFDGLVAAGTASDGRLELSLRVNDAWLDKTVLSYYAGTGGIEGSADIKGKVKPLAIGAPKYVEPVLIDAVNSVFQFHAYGPAKAVLAALERLVRFPTSVGDYATYAALVAATIPPGRFATCLAQGLVRFGAPPVGVITLLVEGDNGSADGWIRTPGKVINRLATLAGAVAGQIDTASLAALDAAVPRNMSLYLTEQTSARDIIQSIAGSCNAVAGIGWTGKLFVCRAEIGTPALTLKTDGSALPIVGSPSLLESGAPYGRMQMGAARTWRVHSFDEIAFTAQLVDMGGYVATTTYREGNIATDQDSTWLYINPTPTAGNAPPTLPQTENGYWRVLAKRGDNGANGAGAFNLVANGTSSNLVAIEGNRVYTTANVGEAWGNAGAYSRERYTGGAFASFSGDDVGGRDNERVMVALNGDGSADANYIGLDHAVYFFKVSSGYWVSIYEVGAQVAGGEGVWAWGAPQVWSIVYDGRYVRYLRDGAEMHKTDVGPGRTYGLDIAFYGNGGDIRNIVFGPVAGNQAVPFTLTPHGPNGASITVNGGSVVTTNAGSAWDRGVSSKEAYTGGCMVSWTVPNTTFSDLMVALNSDPLADGHYGGLDHALETWETGGTRYYAIYESGSNPGGAVVFNWNASTIFAIVYDGANVIYLIDNTPVRSIYVGPGKKFYLDSSFNGWGQRVEIIAFQPIGKSALDVTPQPPTRLIQCDADGAVKSGQLPAIYGMKAYLAGAEVTGTLSITGVSGCTATVSGTSISLNSVAATQGEVRYSYSYGGHTVAGRVTFAKTADSTANAAVRKTLTSSTPFSSTSMSASGDSLVLVASATGKLKVAGQMSFASNATQGSPQYCYAKLQYRPVGGVWADATGLYQTSAAYTLVIPGEPAEVERGFTDIPAATLAGLTANGNYEVQMVGYKMNGSYTVSQVTGYIYAEPVA